MVVMLQQKSVTDKMSKLEKATWEQWLPTLPIKDVWYEPISFRCAGGRYTPDLAIHIAEDFQISDDIFIKKDTMLFIEIKGSWKQRGADRSKRIFREAAGQFKNWGRWLAVLPKKKHVKKGELFITEWTIQEY